MMGLGFGGLGMIAMVIFWIFVVALAVWLLSYLFPRRVDGPRVRDGHTNASSTESALEILKRRYARGEISREEYETVRRDLADQ